MRLIGILLGQAKDDPEWQPWISAFRQALQELAAAARRLDALATRRARLNLCPKCNYDRTGLAATAVCPECAAPGLPARRADRP